MKNKVLVAYFSCTGYTRELAKKINIKVNGDLFEIEPMTPYTNEDLDWTNEYSRSSQEMKNMNNRPPIKSRVSNINQYDTIYIGFPIWWGKAPTIINTFLESYNLNGKVIIPFATYHSSGVGETDIFLKPSCKDAYYRNAVGFVMGDFNHIDELIR